MNVVNIAAIKRTADVALGIAHDHYRLESGQSTSNQSLLIGQIEELQALKRSKYSHSTNTIGSHVAVQGSCESDDVNDIA